MNDPSPPALVVDPAGFSLTHFLVFVFPSRRARSEALALARAAALYSEGEVQGRHSCIAAFDKTPEQASLALRLQRFLRNSDYVDQYAGGKLLDNRHMDGVIACYIQARKCGDTRAHCVTVESRAAIFANACRTPAVVYDELMDTLAAQRPPQRYRFPCSYLREQRFQIDTDHPSHAVDQIRGAAVRHGCDWCPLFDAREFSDVPAISMKG